ncbi:MAG: precorrin-8X methylmutase [Deferrisomatales bacterium]
MTQPTAVIVVGHGTRDADANAAFEELVAAAATRLPGVAVAPAHLSMAEPGVEARAAELVAGGARRLVLLPYFLLGSSHVRDDLPRQAGALRAAHPGVEVEVLPCLQGDPALEDLVVDRVAALLSDPAELPETGPEIEALSHRIIDRRLARAGLPPGEAAVVRRVVHATADFSFAETLWFHPEAVARGVEALRAKAPVVCDVQMLAHGVTRAASEVLCAIGDPDVAEAARRHGTTRAAAAMAKLAPRLEGAVVAVGNAPTALWKLMEMARRGGPRPALIVGLPVGFVGARESKLALIASGLVSIANTSPRGGSPVAAAAVNALALLAREAGG